MPHKKTTNNIPPVIQTNLFWEAHANEPVVVTNSNEYLSALKTSDPLIHNIKCNSSH